MINLHSIKTLRKIMIKINFRLHRIKNKSKNKNWMIEHI